MIIPTGPDDGPGDPPQARPVWIFPDAVWSGFLVGFVVQVAVVFGLFATRLAMGAVAIGLVQLLWMLPLSRHLTGRGCPRMARGVLLVVGLTVLLNATCFGILIATEF